MEELALFAKHYHKLGLNVTCLSEKLTEYNFYCKNRMKAPNHKWVHLLSSRQSDNEFNNINWSDATGVGCTGGYNDLHILDIDGCPSYELVENMLAILGLPKTYEWVVKTGSKYGYHIFLYTEKFPDLKENEVVSVFNPKSEYLHLIEKIEFLWATNVALPPSLHPSGNKYKFVNCDFPQALPTEIDQSKLYDIVRKYLDVSYTETKIRYSEIVVEIEYSEAPSDIDDVFLGEGDPDKILVLDIETDGLIANNNSEKIFPKIIQIAWLIMDKKGKIYKKSSSLIKDPTIDYNKAHLINNIDEYVAAKIGNKLDDVITKLARDMQYVKHVVSHNANFDISILKYYFQREGLPNLFNRSNIICTMQLGQDICKIGYPPYKYPKLTELYNSLFGTHLTQLHNAEADVVATTICFKKMLETNIVKL
jgi:DNA polymerase III epsilon subunit-like protein